MTIQQKKIFLEGEGDGWYTRNVIAGEKLAQKKQIDPVLRTVIDLNLQPACALEIGASNGWRLHLLQSMIPGLSCAGVEPSAKAVTESYPGIDMRQGAADRLDFADESFDLVIFGFCLYLCDRHDLFRIAAEADRVLQENGHLAIFDFCPPVPYKNPYVHKAGAYSYKMDYSRLFTGNPAYRQVYQYIAPHPGTTDQPDNRTGVQILQKNTGDAWPDNPYKK
jgi:SAM-dependent methyltransferase